MRSRLPALAALTVAAVCHAQPASVVPWMTGERLVKLLDRTGREDAKWENGVFTKAPQTTPADRTDEEIAAAYITGVHDVTEGKAWCWAQHRPAPETLQEQAIWGLRELPAGRLRENAGSLIVEIWAAKHPCPAQYGRRQ